MYKLLLSLVTIVAFFNVLKMIKVTTDYNQETQKTSQHEEVKKLIYVVTVNGGFTDFFTNWRYHANKAGVSDEDILVITEDTQSNDFMKSNYPNIIVHGKDYGMSPEAHVYNTGNYIKMVSKRPGYLLSLLKNHIHDILYVDIDTVLLGDIRDLIKEEDDMVFGIDATNVMGVENYYCTGIMYFKNCEDSIKVLDKWNEEINKKNQLNQPLFNKVVRSLEVKHRPFDKFDVMSGKTIKENGIKGITKLVHANYIQGHQTKVNMLSEYKLWYPKLNVAICTCVRFRKGDTRVEDLDIHKSLITSIEKTVTKAERGKYNVEIYIYYDDDDEFWLTNSTYDWTKVTEFPVHMHVTPRTDRIPWNEVTRHAFDKGADYFFRTNDDVVMQSSGWIDLAVNRLKEMNNVGVVGPKSLKGNTNILTLDFTHRNHLKIFENYYPPEFKNWYVDDFITYVYNERLQIIPEWKALHLVKPTRYSIYSPKRSDYAEIMKNGKDAINKFIRENDIPIVVGSNIKGLKCVTVNAKTGDDAMPRYFDYWIQCEERNDDICDMVPKEHILPNKSNGFLLDIKKVGKCSIIPRNVFKNKMKGMTRSKHIQTQTVY